MRLLLSICFLAFSWVAMAQPGHNRVHKKDMDQLKIQHITSEVGLSRGEGQTFWPIYNKFSDEKDKIHQQLVTIEKDLQEKKDLDEAAQLNLLKQVQTLKKKKADLEYYYAVEVYDALGKDKGRQILNADRSFRKKLAKRIMNKNGENPPPPPPPMD